MTIKVTIGCPIAEREWVVDDWANRCLGQATDDIEIAMVCLYTDSEDDTLDRLNAHGVDILYDRFLKTRDRHRIDNHLWDVKEGEYQYLALLRNNLVSFVQRTEADYFFSLDSDILLPHANVVSTLIDRLKEKGGGAISPLVNLSKFGTQDWNFMRWEQRTPGLGLRHSPLASTFRADALMAAILMDPFAMQARWAQHPQGEDLGWSLDCMTKGISLWVEPTIEAEHAMHVSRRQ